MRREYGVKARAKRLQPGHHVATRRVPTDRQPHVRACAFISHDVRVSPRKGRKGAEGEALTTKGAVYAPKVGDRVFVDHKEWGEDWEYTIRGIVRHGPTNPHATPRH